MVAVNAIDALKYGFRLLGYLLAITIVGGILIVVGGMVSGGPANPGNPILALIFWLAGLVVVYAGGLGFLYKVISDGVAVGTRAAQSGSAPPKQRPGNYPQNDRRGGQPQGGQPQGGHPQGGQAQSGQYQGNQTERR